MPWFRKREQRQGDYTDTLVRYLTSQAAGSSPVSDPAGLGALAAAAQFLGNSLAVAELRADAPDRLGLISPTVRYRIGVDLIRRGQSVLLISMNAGAISLTHSSAVEVTGTSPDSSGWTYRLDLPTPDGVRQVTVGADSVAHFMFEQDPRRPWQGRSPLDVAYSTGALAAALESRLGEETSAIVANLIPIPSDGGDGGDEDPLRLLKSDIAKAGGGHLLVETTSRNWGDDQAKGRSVGDWTPRRLGANPPQTLALLRDAVQTAVWHACGLPPGLFENDADGTSQREAFRRALNTFLDPISARISQVAAEALDIPGLRFNFERLYAHDLVGRAGAFSRLVAGGVTVEDALRVAGLDG